MSTDHRQRLLRIYQSVLAAVNGRECVRRYLTQHMGSAAKPVVPAESRGLHYGLLAVMAFSLTLPATRVAVADLDPVFVGLGRSVAAAGIALLILLFTRPCFPTRDQWRGLALVAASVVVGFPLLTAWAMERVPASHGAILLGVLPLVTAAAGALRAHERPSPGFWIAGLAGSILVVAFALISGAGKPTLADLALLGAVLAAALGYAEGGRLARTLGGWQVICWALVLAAPFLVIPVVLSSPQHAELVPVNAWLAFAYVALVSQLFGFFIWYHALALGGIARIGQLQLLQPFFTLFAAGFLLGERITSLTVVFALAVVVTVAVGRKMTVQRQVS